MMKKLLIIRFLTNPISVKTLNPNSLISSIRHSNYTFPTHRCFSNNISNQYVSPKLVSQVIALVRNSNGQCRSQLDLMDTRLSNLSICEIIRVLTCEKVPALQFFDWIRHNNPNIYRNTDLCSLIIDNCGWLNDYDTMRYLLKRFKHENICINDKAFGFMPVIDSTKAHSMESISLLISVLDEIGGSVRSSGVYSLIGMLCATDCFELANYAIEITEKKVNYYAVLVREKCRRGCTDDACDVIKRMRVEGCEPETKIYNYVLGSLCKNNKLSEALRLLEEMKQAGVDPDEITFEIFISSACRLGNMEVANESFERLVETGRVPRLLTYAAMVRGYFNGGRYEDAYVFVRGVEVKGMPQVQKMYSLLARLHRTNGDVDVAARILDEMMERGLKPEFSNYAKTTNVLRHVGSKDLACDLRRKFSKFRVPAVI